MQGSLVFADEEQCHRMSINTLVEGDHQFDRNGLLARRPEPLGEPFFGDADRGLVGLGVLEEVQHFELHTPVNASQQQQEEQSRQS